MDFDILSHNPRADHGRFRLLDLLLATAVTAIFTMPHAVRAAEPAAGQAEIMELVRDFKSAGRDQQQRAAVVERAVTLGYPATQRLQLIISKEMSKPLEGYRKRFTQAALRLSVQRAAQINLNEITALRQRFRALSENDNLSKQQISSQGDPIIEQLEQMLVVERSDIIASRPELAKQRQQLEEIGLLWEQCALIAYDEFLKSTADPEMRQRVSKPSIAAALDSEEEIAARLAMPMAARDRSVLAANARQASRLEQGESRAILATNLLRMLVGQTPCVIDLRLAAAARDHSADMQKLNFFSHESPVQGKQQFTSRATNFGTSASAENIAINGGNGAAVVQAWYYSPGHHRNMFGNHRRIGIGQAGRYWTQMFGR